MAKNTVITSPPAERVFLVGVGLKEADHTRWPVDSSLAELAQLAATAGAEVVGQMIQRLERPSPQHYLGSGKLSELMALKQAQRFDAIIFDDELTPRQQRNLEEALGTKIIDRTALILDIFAKRAHTHEGRLQVELAQHRYLLPRLAGQWSHLERLGGGIGTRGPGESQLETDRRLIRNRIHRLEQALERVRRHRALYRAKRRKSGMPVVALIGYTNAGKSTLLNTLSHADVFVEDKLFATLDPTTRRLTLPNKKTFLLSDTVGFIQKLPPTVVAAFRATLEELAEADLLLHVVDITHKNAAKQCQTVEDILAELHLADKPRILVLNKIDLIGDGRASGVLASIPGAEGQSLEQPAVLISAARGWGLDRLLSLVEERLDYVK
ncbi:MAG TPA: GTPase HflX [Dehalococcoidia bacterium]|nr:GTPase HflX [Dehalococcoidia bacterium]